MSVNSVNSVPVYATSANASNNVKQGTTFRGAQTDTISFSGSEAPKSGKKKLLTGAAIVGSLAAVGVTVWAGIRGKKVNKFLNQDTKLLSNLQTGFKTFFGEGKGAYKEVKNYINNGVNSIYDCADEFEEVAGEILEEVADDLV